MRISHALTAVLVACAAVIAPAQPATPAQMEGVAPNPDFATLHFRSNLGSFRIIDGKGRLEVTFTGTILISKLKGKFKVDGKTKTEYQGNDRTLINGKGRLVVTGDWRAVQFFGRQLTGVWYGFGIARFQGEFDRNLETGEYWYDDPTEKRYWLSTNIVEVPLPGVQIGVSSGVSGRRKK